ncbi:MAG: hypothetical protein AAB110_09235 [Candidatus Desantisbacteria bacterium]
MAENRGAGAELAPFVFIRGACSFNMTVKGDGYVKRSRKRRVKMSMDATVKDIL